MASSAGHLTENMSKSGAGQQTLEHAAGHPKKGEHYRCPRCGMEVEVEKDCHCHDEAEHFHCCGQAMQKC